MSKQKTNKNHTQRVVAVLFHRRMMRGMTYWLTPPRFLVSFFIFVVCFFFLLLRTLRIVPAPPIHDDDDNDFSRPFVFIVVQYRDQLPFPSQDGY